MSREYDFAGWVTKSDTLCSDGVTIRHDAFKADDGTKVPLVWNHNYSSPNNVLGHVELKNEKLGVYGYGFFNDTDEAQNAKELVRHGDISSMSIGARKIKRSGSNVVHGNIYEVSLVLSGANPGAMIESVINHSEDGTDEENSVVYTGNLIHTPEDIINHSTEPKKDEEETLEHKEQGGSEVSEKTIGEIIDAMTEEQQEAVYALVGMAVEDEEGDDDVKHNVFNAGSESNQGEVLKHSINEAIDIARSGGVSSLQDVILQHLSETGEDEETIQHGINSIEMLFPEAAHSTNGNVPIIYKDPNTSYKQILNSVNKSPFSRVRTLVADLTEEEARAKGYVKGSFKKEEFFSLIKRQTGPTTIYKKQKLDRDDIIDITDFNIVAFMNQEMRMMLEEELARAILVGDGREIDDEDKINEENIRPIITDHEFFTIQKKYNGASDFVEAVIKAMSEYRGSGLPTMYIDPTILADVKLLKGTDGRFLFGDIPSTQAIATRLGVKDIVETTFMVGHGALIVNLRDYTLGANKGGEITTFDDFDIDFNQHKYLIETRLSGALTLPKSAIHLSESTVTGANDKKGGMTYGKRQADREAEEGDKGSEGN